MHLSVKSRAEKILSYTRKAPRMFAFTRESYCNRVATVLEMCDFNFNGIDFYKKHLRTEGCAYLDGSLEIEDSWAREVVDDALKILREANMVSFS